MKDREQYNEYLNQYMKERWNRRRFQALIYLGGRCFSCGIPYFISPLEFHHEDPSKKVSSIAKLSSASEQKFWEEVNKCVLLCDDCHTNQHRSVAEHGTPQRYWAGCKCKSCKKAYSDYTIDYRRKRGRR